MNITDDLSHASIPRALYDAVEERLRAKKKTNCKKVNFPFRNFLGRDMRIQREIPFI